jgi:hypothetical protein
VWDSWQQRFRLADGEYLPVVDPAGNRELAVGQCLARANEEKCKTMPVFMPGKDVYEAAEHDFEAIAAARPVHLQYATEDEKISNGMLRAQCGTVGDGLDCDEYPFYSTLEGGGPNASLKPLNPADNQKEGRLLVRFYTVCGVNVARRDFLTLPIVIPGDKNGRPGFNSMAFCRPGESPTTEPAP